jgi:hypothetical protein
MKLAARILVAGLATAFLMGVALAPERAAAAEVVREKCVSSGDWRTLETFWNTTATGWFQSPAGAEIRVKYGVGWLSVSRQRQTLDGYALKSLQVGAWSKIGARMQIRVPQTTCVTYRIAFEGP